MKSPVHCQLLLPVHELEGDAEAALRALLRHAQRVGTRQGGAEAWLCAQFALPAEQEIPVGPYAALGDGLPAEDGYWLRADPVSLVLQRDSFALAEAPSILQMAQSQRLAEALNAHFAADGMRFFVAAPHRWYLRLAHIPELHTQPLPTVLHRDIQAFLPQGKDALRWHRLLNEVQMLLHAHPVNVELEEQGAVPVNSVWVWGGSELRRGVAPAFRLWADDPLPQGLALAHDMGCSPLPVSIQDWWAQADPGRDHVMVLSAKAAGQWLRPLGEAVRQGRLALTLHLAGTAVTRYTLARRDFLKFWRRPRPLEYYLG